MDAFLSTYCGNGWEPWHMEVHVYGSNLEDEVTIYFKRKKIIEVNDLPTYLKDK